ncbi:Nodulation protein D 2 [Marinomonas spartinae]|uniref:Nodulation protein D 2 n=1 Tax=Marinomonas spartinae TaxID=1792290 RepID=A0A1A8TEH8_9GAMM|nr:LysR family transcriptional regulator [Marinomonas spartinae]SBS31350.1 Nodulation protein D 2 [Marinomonas spartinae]
MAEPDLNLLVALDALLTEESVAGAARRLKLSASAMSRTLNRLRVVTKDPLLVRAGRHMVLTPYAQGIRNRTRDTVFEARNILNPLSSPLNLSTLKRTFTIRANDGFIEAFAASLISAVAISAPLVRLRFASKSEKNVKYLREGQADLEIGVLDDTMGPEIRLQALFRDRFSGVVRKNHPLHKTDSITPEQYVSYGHVIASRRGLTKGPVDNALTALGLERHIAAIVPSFPAVLTVIQTSDLVGLVPDSFLNNHKKLNGHEMSAFHTFELPVKTDTITISQMWHPRLDKDLAHRWLRTLVLDVCQQKMPN